MYIVELHNLLQHFYSKLAWHTAVTDALQWIMCTNALDYHKQRFIFNET
jgi:hypothetical protein